MLEGILEGFPGARTLGPLPGESRFAEAVLDGIQRHFDVVADVDFEFAAFVAELACGITASDLRPALTTTASEEIYYPSRQDGARFDPLVGQALLEKFGEIPRHVQHRQMASCQFPVTSTRFGGRR